jgi:predicted CXXCH cytochrome family protein
MSDQGAVLLAGGPRLCAECHADLVASASADTGHYPAGEDCLNCHQPHTAEQDHLLLEARGEICATCHDLEPDGDLAAPHLGADPSRLDCLGCHSPHGTGNFKSLAENLHPPLEDGCDTCHEGGHDELMEGGGTELCLFCHEDPSEGHAVPHEALELASCTDCHNPHATAQEKLVKAPGAGPCGDCHDQVAGSGEVAHGVIDLVGCRACHEPHGGEREKLLRASGDELCLSCHLSGAGQLDESTGTLTLLGRFAIPRSQLPDLAQLLLSADGQHDHPIRGHRVAGTPTEEEMHRTDVDFTGELTCLTCHDAHKGKSKKIFRWDAASSLEACQHCHNK